MLPTSSLLAFRKVALLLVFESLERSKASRGLFLNVLLFTEGSLNYFVVAVVVAIVDTKLMARGDILNDESFLLLGVSPL